MPIHQEVQFLRDRAQRLREAADAYRTPLSARIRTLARELADCANELERAGLSDPNGN